MMTEVSEWMEVSNFCSAPSMLLVYIYRCKPIIHIWMMMMIPMEMNLFCVCGSLRPHNH